jgi:hypothetical protein
VLKGNSWINIATATGDYQRIRVVLDTKSRRHMVLIDNKIVYSQEYPSTWVFGHNGLLRFQLTGGTAVSVDDLDSIYACRVYLGEMHIYTSEAYAYENMIANKSKNGIRVARFESDLYNGSSLDMTVFKAKYNNNACICFVRIKLNNSNITPGYIYLSCILTDIVNIAILINIAIITYLLSS